MNYISEYSYKLKELGISDEDIFSLCAEYGSFEFDNNLIFGFFDKIKFRQSFINKAPSGRKITFKIKAQFDKRYYISAKLADEAEDVFMSRSKGRFFVTFDTCDFNIIEQLYFNELYYISWTLEEDDIKFIEEYTEVGYAGRVCKSFFENVTDVYETEYKKQFYLYLWAISSCIDSHIRKKHEDINNDLYEIIKAEGRVNIKWKREYELYICIKNLFSDAIFQYSSSELNGQSFDIFIPSVRVAIEYQGEQHYKSNEFFGGEIGLASNQERDKRKKRVAEQNGITILYWKYDHKINSANFIDFLKKNKCVLKYEYLDDNFPEDMIQNRNIEMAPKIVERYSYIRKEQKKIKEDKIILLQYSLQGDFICGYKSVTEAAKKISISATSINKVLNGLRNTAGGYVWEKNIFDKEIPAKIEIKFDTNKTNSGLSKRIIQLSMDNIAIAEYSSIVEAGRVTGINAKEISKCINGHKKNAGGFIWNSM